MKDGDKADCALLEEHERTYASGTANRLLDALVELDSSLSGYQVSCLGHSLQAATRASRVGAYDDWVVSALLHDIGDIHAPYNHDEYAASILRPFVREKRAWVVEKYGDFQMVYFGHHVRGDPHKRDRWRDSPYAPTVHSFANSGTSQASTPTIRPKPSGSSLRLSTQSSPDLPIVRPMSA